MAIRRACTYKAVITLPYAPSHYSAILVTLQQNGINLINKNKSQLTVGTADVTLNLTQQETAQFEAGTPAYLQIRVSLLEEINKRAEKIGRVVNVLIEVNSGREEAKGGILPEDVAEFCKRAREYKSVCVRGLMTMAPKCQTKEEYLYYFGIVKQLFDELFDKDAILSMGMSDSYEYAIEAGATMVRVGSKIFGERKY